MNNYTISASAIRRFSYCPRWYYINYILGFHAKSPVKAKFPIGDAIHKALAERNKTKFRDRINDLVRSEEMVDEGIELNELIERGEILVDKALHWLSQFDSIIWQEKFVQHKITTKENQEILLNGYPDLVAMKNSTHVLMDYKIGYDVITQEEAFAYVLPLTLYKMGLINANIKIDKAMIVSMVLRTRKDRYSTRAKTPIVDVIEVPVEMTDAAQATLINIAEHMITCIEKQSFPALGITNGVCSWCPNGRGLKDMRLCFYPDDILKEFSKTSLQRVSIEKWRDEF